MTTYIMLERMGIGERKRMQLQRNAKGHCAGLIFKTKLLQNSNAKITCCFVLMK